ncbi:MAG: YceK/YidQ family lipoprotein [Ewingella americana]|nr:YceK/YidQ family lipoprotein [Ewingella americana]MCI1679930.1 YceK/YidQ family lipoprotein [Ewingella americana]MCI1855614.1 YceK/YidQ family lipoprotein [Ewingella americana]MCI1862892.1 YceK/YidQ family lipoprotein [Ewingella americana]MCI2140566.1 YceK/YidQ family lipoprotein [Ewingella americana]MCI2165224.1 YceK/YidQ family lipoprotein [Ewingella americana]
MKSVLLPLVTGCAFLSVSGCSSVMSHTGGHQGYYPGTRADVSMISSEDTSWAMTPLLIVDLPFSALLDTLLLPYDYYRQDKLNTRDRIKASEEQNLAISHGIDIDHVPPMTESTKQKKRASN